MAFLAVPEVAAAAEGAGGAAAAEGGAGAAEGGAGSAADHAGTKITPGMAPGRVQKILHHRKLKAQAEARHKAEAKQQQQQRIQADQADQTADEHDPTRQDLPAAEERAASRLFDRMEPASTGSGFVLGVMGWALLRAWIGNPGTPSGAAGVKALLRAKFLNQTS